MRSSHKREIEGSIPSPANMIKSGDIFYYGASKIPGIVLETHPDGTVRVYEVRDDRKVYAGGAIGHFDNFKAKDQREARKIFIKRFFNE